MTTLTAQHLVFKKYLDNIWANSGPIQRVFGQLEIPVIIQSLSMNVLFLEI